MSAKYAFRCKNCGRLEAAGHAGDCTHPAACRVCGSGVSFCPKTGRRTHHDQDNWEILADASPERLSELGLTPGDVDRHGGSKTMKDGAVRSVTAADGIRVQDSVGA